MIEALKQSAEDVSKVYDILAFGHTERALEILAKTRTSLRQAIAELESQEPVATVTSETGADITMSWWHEPALPVGTKLFTHPPQRTWVGLTDEESSLLLNQSDLLDMFENIGWYSAPKNGFKKNSATLIRAIEAKLKQKNGYAEEKNT